MSGNDDETGDLKHVQIRHSVKLTNVKESWNKRKFRCVIVDDSDDVESGMFADIQKQGEFNEQADCCEVQSNCSEVQSNCSQGQASNEKNAVRSSTASCVTIRQPLNIEKQRTPITLCSTTNNIDGNCKTREQLSNEKLSKPTEDCTISILSNENCEMDKLKMLFNERVKIDYSNGEGNSEDVSAAHGLITEKRGEQAYKQLHANIAPQMVDDFNSDETSIERKRILLACEALNNCGTTTVTEDIAGKKSNVTIKKEISEISKAETSEICNIHSSLCNDGKMVFGKTDHNVSIENNDVIAQVFKTGKRQRICSKLLKSRQYFKQHRKVIYPILIKDQEIKTEGENIENKLIDNSTSQKQTDTAIVPLLQFQSSVEQQIKELIENLKELHSVEKDVIINALTTKYQLTNKEMVESLSHLLGEKMIKLLQEQKKSINNEVVQGNMHASSEKCTDTTLGTSKQNVCNKPCGEVLTKVYHNEVATLEVDDSANGTKAKTSHNGLKGLKGHNGLKGEVSPLASSKCSDMKKTNAACHSLLRTPVRRRKAPLPFSENMQVENNPASISNEVSEHGCALLHEILKDCSGSKDVSLENKENTNSEVQNCAKQSIDRINLTSDMKGNKLINALYLNNSTRNTSDTVINHSRQPFENIINTKYTPPENKQNEICAIDTSGQFSSSTLKTVVDNKYSNTKIDIGASNHSNINTLTSYNDKYNCIENLSLDERLHRLQDTFINSENEWLYKSKSHKSIPIENFEKLLKEVEMKRKVLEHNDIFTDSERVDTFTYFDEYPNLVTSDVLIVKRNISEQIKNADSSVHRKLDGQKGCKQRK